LTETLETEVKEESIEEYAVTEISAEDESNVETSSEELAYDDTADIEKIEELKIERDKQLRQLQDFTFYVFEVYYDLGIEYHIYDEGSNLGSALKDDALSALGVDSSAVGNIADALIDGISNGDGYTQIVNNMYESGIEGLTDDVIDAITDELFDSSVVTVIKDFSSLFASKPQLDFLLSQLEHDIETSYFDCLKSVLELDEWDEDLIFECERKSNNLQALLATIENITGSGAGADVWREYYYNLGSYINNYYALADEIDFYENVKGSIDYDYNISVDDEVSRYQTLAYDIFYGDNVNELDEKIFQINDIAPTYYYDYEYAVDSSIANNIAGKGVSSIFGNTIGSLLTDSASSDDNERLYALVKFNYFVDDYLNSHAKALNEIRKYQIRYENLKQLAFEDNLTLDDVYRLKELENYRLETSQILPEQLEMLEYPVAISYIVSLAYENVLSGTDTGSYYADEWYYYFQKLYDIYSYLYGNDIDLIGNVIDEQVLYDAYMELIEASCKWLSMPKGVKSGEIKCFVKGKGDYKVYVYYREDGSGNKNCFYAQQVDRKGNEMGTYFVGYDDVLCVKDSVNNLSYYYDFQWACPTDYTYNNQNYVYGYETVALTARNILYSQKFEATSSFFY
jgi:hypothetical protein